MVEAFAGILEAAVHLAAAVLMASQPHKMLAATNKWTKVRTPPAISSLAPPCYTATSTFCCNNMISFIATSLYYRTSEWSFTLNVLFYVYSRSANQLLYVVHLTPYNLLLVNLVNFSLWRDNRQSAKKCWGDKLSWQWWVFCWMGRGLCWNSTHKLKCEYIPNYQHTNKPMLPICIFARFWKKT